MSKQLFSINEAAAKLGVSAKTLRRWEKRGLISPQRTIGNQRRYLSSDLEALMETNNRNSAPKIQSTPKSLENKERFFDIASIKAPEPITKPQIEPESKFLQADIKKTISKHQTPKLSTFMASAPIRLGLTFFTLLGIALMFGHFSRFINPAHFIALLPHPNTTKSINVQPDDQVLAAATQKREFALKINVPAEFMSTASVAGKLTAPNILYSIVPGTNIAVSGDPQNPTISATGVSSLQGQTGAVALTAGSGISISGLTISSTGNNSFENIKVGSNTITAGSSTDTLEFVAGSGINLSADTSNKKLTITNSSTSTALSGLTTNGVLYADSSTTAVSLTPGTSGYVLQSNGSGSPPSWILNSASNPAFSAITSGTNTTAAMVVGAGASLTYSGGTATSGVINANQLLGGTWAAPGTIGSTTPNSGSFTALSASGAITFSSLTTNGGLLYTNGSGVVTQTGAGSSTTVLHGGTTPSYSAVSLTADVTGTLPIANGGTNNSSSYTNGSVIFSNGTSLTQNNSQFFWDNTNNRLGLGVNSNLAATLDVRGSSGTLPIASISGTTAFTGLLVDNNGVGNLFTASKSGAPKFTILNNGNLSWAGTTNFQTTFASAATANQTITVPDTSGTGGTICLTTGNCAGTGGNGDVIGPGSSTDTALVRFNGTTGKSIQNSGVLLDASNNMTGVNSLSILPATNITGLTLTGTNVTSGKLAYFNAKNSSGTIFDISYGAAQTLTGALIGQAIDLNNGSLTATNQNVTGQKITLPTITNTNALGTESLLGLQVTFGSGAGINQNGAGATIFSDLDVTLPALTQTSGTLTANGLAVTTPSSITTGGVANGLLISPTGIGAGTLNGVNVATISAAGAGNETALNIGSGWDTVLRVNGTPVINGQGVTLATGGGTGLSTYTTGDILYASATNTLSALAGGVANNGKALVISAGVPTWGVISGSSCTDCVINDPTSSTTNTIAPTGQTTTGLIVKQTSTASPTNDIFQITDSTGGTVYFKVDKDGNVFPSTSIGNTLTLTPTTNTTALTLVGTNVTTASLQYINAKNTSGTIFNLAYGVAQTLSTSLATTGIAVDLSTNVTAANADVTAEALTLPAETNTITTGTKSIKGVSISGGGLNQNGAGGTTTFAAFDATIPPLTQTAGTLNGYGVNVTTPSSITTAGTAAALNVAASGVGAGSLYGLNISAITGGAGSETAINIGSGWDSVLKVNNTTVIDGSGNLNVANATGILPIANGGSPFEQGSGAIFPRIITQDLLIGGISSPSASFHVFGASPFKGTNPVASIAANTSFAGLVVDNKGAGDLFTASSSGLPRFTINNNGNVGIGTTLPTALLDVNGSASLSSSLVFRGGAASIQTTQNSPLTFGGNAATGEIVFAPAGAVAMRLDTFGSVHVGTDVNIGRYLGVGIDASSGTQLRIQTVNSSTVGLDITGSNNQTANLLNLNPSFGNTQAWFDESGNLRIGGSAPDNGKLNITGAYTGKALAIFDETGDQDIFSASASGVAKFTLTRAGGIKLGTNEGSSSQCLTSGGAGGAATWQSCAIGQGTNFWQSVNPGTITPYITTVDTLFGGVSTASATLRIAGSAQSGIQPVASIAANTSFAGLVIDNKGKGDLFTASSSGLPRFTINNNGNVGIGTTLPSAQLHIVQTSTTNGGVRIDGINSNLIPTFGIFDDAGVAAFGYYDGYRTTTINGGSIALKTPALTVEANNGGSTSLQVGSTTSAPLYSTSSVATISANTSFAALVVDNSGVGDLFTASKSGASKFTILNNGNISWAGESNFQNVLSTSATAIRTYTFPDASGTICLQSSGSCGFALGTNFWQSVNAGTITPYITTVDTLFGGVSTASATLRIAGSAQSGIQPVASISANTSFAGLVVDNKGRGDLFTASSSGATRFTIKQNGNIRIGDGGVGNVPAGPSSFVEIMNQNIDSLSGVGVNNNYHLMLWNTSGTNNTGTGIAFANTQDVNNVGASIIFNRTGSNSQGELQFYTKQSTTANAAPVQAMTISNTGAVGIGDATPDTTLKVNGSLCVKNSAANCAGSTSGNIYATNTTVQAADLAENYISSQQLEPGDVIMPEDNGNNQAVTKTTSAYEAKTIGIVSTNPGVTLNSDATTDSIHPYLYPIALAGRIPLKVSSINGDIHTGDYLTASSIPGVAMKATKAGFIIGKALENYTNTDTSAVNKILSFVHLSWYDPDVYLTSTGNISVFEKAGAPSLDPVSTYGVKMPDGSEVIRSGVFSEAVVGKLKSGSLDVQSLTLGGTNINDKLLGLENGVASFSAGFTNPIASLQTQVLSLSDRVASLEAKLSASDSAMFNFNLAGFTASSGAELNLDKLNVSGSIISDKLSVISYATVNDLSVNGTLTAGLLQIKGLDNGGSSISTLNGDLKLQNQGYGGIDILNGKITIDTQGNLIANSQITAKKFNLDTTDTLSASAGISTVKAGNSTTIINTSAVTSSSIIQVTFSGDYYPATRYWISSKATGHSFTVQLNKPVDADTKFNWWIIN